MKKILVISILFLVTSMLFAANPESDFNYSLSSDGESIIITGLKNDLSVYDIPATIEEIPVSSVEIKESLGYKSEKEVTLKLPEGLKEFSLLQRSGGVKSHTIITGLPASLEKCDIRSQQNKKNPKQFYISVKGSINKLDKLTQFKSEYTEFEEKLVIIKKEWQYKISAYADPKYSFNGTNIEEVVFEEGLEIIDGFKNCPNLKKVTLPSTVKKIGDYAFSFSTNFSEIIIPDSVEKIDFISGNQIFDGTSIPLKTQAKLRKLGYKGKFGNS